jgi:hypothetical protein
LARADLRSAAAVQSRAASDSIHVAFTEKWRSLSVGPPELFLFRAQAVRLEGPRHALIIVVRDCATLFGTAGLIIIEEEVGQENIAIM